MKREIISGKVIASLEGWSTDPAEYEGCTFRNLDLADVSLAENVFSECIFSDCNLSNTSVRNTAFRKVSFRNCKLLGLQFEDCHSFLLEMSFDYCNLGMASFRALNLTGTVFAGCLLHEADFSESNLKKSVFRDSDLLNAVFDYTEMDNADLTSARNYVINPERNKLKGARFSCPEVQGLLSVYGVVLL